jgi:DNA-damage-inducible protein J
MANLLRTATIQARVVPLIKHASELVLFRIGLNMSEAVELFLHRVVIDERIPFPVEAITAESLRAIAEALERDQRARTAEMLTIEYGRGGAKSKKFKKIFSGASRPKISGHRKALKSATTKA